MIRREVLEAAIRARELIVGVGLSAIGGWLVWLGGAFFVPLGVLVLAVATGWTVLAVRRMRFGQPGDGPGLVEVLEGQITYYGPNVGGAVGLPDLVEIRLMTLQGQRVWRLKQADGQAILIPVAAAGAAQLFDAFAALPGMDTAALVAALQGDTSASGTAVAIDGLSRMVWQRPARGVVVR